MHAYTYIIALINYTCGTWRNLQMSRLLQGSKHLRRLALNSTYFIPAAVQAAAAAASSAAVKTLADIKTPKPGDVALDIPTDDRLSCLELVAHKLASNTSIRVLELGDCWWEGCDDEAKRLADALRSVPVVVDGLRPNAYYLAWLVFLDYPYLHAVDICLHIYIACTWLHWRFGVRNSSVCLPRFHA